VSFTLNNKKHGSVVSYSYHELIPPVMLIEQAGPNSNITNHYLWNSLSKSLPGDWLSWDFTHFSL